MGRRLRIRGFTAAAIGAILIAGAGLFAYSRWGPLPEGPLRPPSEGRGETSGPRALNDPFPLDGLEVWNPTEGTLTIDRVEPEMRDASDGLRVVRVVLAACGVDAECGRPERLPAEIPSRRYGHIRLVLELLRPGAYQADGFRIRYHDSSGKEYEVLNDSYQFRYCNPPETTDGRCRLPSEA